MKFNKVTIIGVGLIGGSIGLAIKKRHIAKEVAGVFRRGSTLRRALKRRAIDKGFCNIEEGVRDADLIIVASPVRSIPSLIEEAAEYAKAGATITDVGSTKRWITKRVEKDLAGCHSIFFVGSHPMAGSERTGVEAARSDLLKGAPCIVTKTKNTNKSALRKVIGFWSSLGVKVTVMTPEEHDRGISLISHLPHLVAFAIAGAVPARYIKYAAEGYGDTTRVASSDPNLWADILLTNRDEVLASTAVFERFYRRLVKSVARNDYSALVKALGSAKAKRDRFSYKNI